MLFFFLKNVFLIVFIFFRISLFSMDKTTINTKKEDIVFQGSFMQGVYTEFQKMNFILKNNNFEKNIHQIQQSIKIKKFFEDLLSSLDKYNNILIYKWKKKSEEDFILDLSEKDFILDLSEEGLYKKSSQIINQKSEIMFNHLGLKIHSAINKNNSLEHHCRINVNSKYLNNLLSFIIFLRDPSIHIAKKISMICYIVDWIDCYLLRSQNDVLKKNENTIVSLFDIRMQQNSNIPILQLKKENYLRIFLLYAALCFEDVNANLLKTSNLHDDFSLAIIYYIEQDVLCKKIISSLQLVKTSFFELFLPEDNKIISNMMRDNMYNNCFYKNDLLRIIVQMLNGVCQTIINEIEYLKKFDDILNSFNKKQLSIKEFKNRLDDINNNNLNRIIRINKYFEDFFNMYTNFFCNIHTQWKSDQDNSFIEYEKLYNQYKEIKDKLIVKKQHIEDSYQKSIQEFEQKKQEEIRQKAEKELLKLCEKNSSQQSKNIINNNQKKISQKKISQQEISQQEIKKKNLYDLDDLDDLVLNTGSLGNIQNLNNIESQGEIQEGDSIFQFKNYQNNDFDNQDCDVKSLALTDITTHTQVFMKDSADKLFDVVKNQLEMLKVLSGKILLDIKKIDSFSLCEIPFIKEFIKYFVYDFNNKKDFQDMHEIVFCNSSYKELLSGMPDQDNVKNILSCIKNIDIEIKIFVDTYLNEMLEVQQQSKEDIVKISKKNKNKGKKKEMIIALRDEKIKELQQQKEKKLQDIEKDIKQYSCVIEEYKKAIEKIYYTCDLKKACCVFKNIDMILKQITDCKMKEKFISFCWSAYCFGDTNVFENHPINNNYAFKVGNKDNIVLYKIIIPEGNGKKNKKNQQGKTSLIEFLNYGGHEIY
jgi:hypothetical protein